MPPARRQRACPRGTTRAELVVERRPVRRSRLAHEVAVEERQAEEELRLERQCPPAFRVGTGGGPPGVGQRLAVTALPPDRDQQRRQAHTVIAAPASSATTSARGRPTHPHDGRPRRSAPSSGERAAAPVRRVEAAANRRGRPATAMSSAARFWSASAPTRARRNGVSTSVACCRASTASARADASATFPARSSAPTTSADT